MSSSRKSSLGKRDPKKVLLEIVKLPENQFCADCGAKGPRWASASLGVFMCIKCSGLHRNLGTHISFVRSVNLDEWKPEQVEKMMLWGNENAKRYFEHDVPSSYQIPNEHASVQHLTRWIRDKYEYCKFVPRGAPERDPRRGGRPIQQEPDNNHDNKEKSNLPMRKVEVVNKPEVKQLPPQPKINKPAPKLTKKAPPAPKPSQPKPAAAVARPPPAPQPDLLDFSEPEPVVAPQPQQQQQQQQWPPQPPQPQAQAAPSFPPSDPSAAFAAPPPQQQQPQQQAPSKMSSDAILAMYAGPGAYGGMHPSVTPTLSPSRLPVGYNGYPSVGGQPPRMMPQQQQPPYFQQQQQPQPFGGAPQQQQQQHPQMNMTGGGMMMMGGNMGGAPQMTGGMPQQQQQQQYGSRQPAMTPQQQQQQHAYMQQQQQYYGMQQQPPPGPFF